MASYDQIDASVDVAVRVGGALTVPYPAGRSASDYEATDATLLIRGFGTTYSQAAGQFTMSLGGSGPVIVLANMPAIPARTAIQVGLLRVTPVDIPAFATEAGSVPWTGVAGKPSTFPPSAHTQAADTITGLGAGATLNLATQISAEAGTATTGLMNELRSKQAIAAQTPVLPFPVYPSADSTPLNQRFRKTIVLTDDCGATGNSGDFCDAALAKAKTLIGEGTYPVCIDPGRGHFKTSGTFDWPAQPLVIKARSIREAIFFPTTSGTAFSCKGDNIIGRLPNCGIRDVLIDCQLQPSTALALDVDFTQDFMFDALLANPGKGINLRHSGGFTFGSHAGIDKARGAFAVYVKGTGAARYGGLDKVDLIKWGDITVTGNYTPGDPAADRDGVVVDGFVHTAIGTVIALNFAGNGVRFDNTPGVDKHFYPSYMNFDIQTENTGREGVWAKFVRDWQGILFSATTTNNLVRMSAGASIIKLKYFGAGAGDSALLVDGGKEIDIWPHLYNNNQSNSGKSHVLITSGDAIRFHGGLIGKDTTETAYTELAAYAINNTGGTNVQALGVDMRGNVSGGISGDVGVRDCLGVDVNILNGPVGAVYSIAASSRNREVYAYGGTNLEIRLNGVIVSASPTGQGISAVIPPGYTADVVSSAGTTVSVVTRN